MRPRFLLCVFAGLAGLAGASVADEPVADGDIVAPVLDRAALETPIVLEKMRRLRVTTGGRILGDDEVDLNPRTDCSGLASRTDANFTGGNFVVQAGFSENEVAATTYSLPANAFPIKIDMMEFIIATSNAEVQTITEWSVLVWDGNPQSGILIAEFSSDDVILPHIRLGPGTAGVNVQVSVDPNDPEQIFIFNDSLTNEFTIGFRIDNHNQQTQDPCVVAPPARRNAFPTTDTSGLASPPNNWLMGLNCGPFGCPANGGWARFSNLPFFCRPTGDWVMRATWSRPDCQPGVGACCKPDGTCQTMLIADCSSIGGIYQGDGVTCDEVTCPEPLGACCLPSGACVPGVTRTTCELFQGSFAGGGTDCSDNDQSGIADACEGPACPADLSGSSDPNSPDYGDPDGTVDSADFFFYLDQFVANNLAIADMSGSSDPNDPNYGIPDGVIDSADFFYYLDAFVLPCP